VAAAQLYSAAAAIDPAAALARSTSSSYNSAMRQPRSTAAASCDRVLQTKWS